MFQFRHGAIKTAEFIDEHGETVGFNSDTVRSKLQRVTESAAPASVSIPTRCDQNGEFGVVPGQKYFVSIPTRCDQNEAGGFSAEALWAFQFRHGAIKTTNPDPMFERRFLFQFRHGAIKTIFWRVIGHNHVCFNSDTVRSKHTTAASLLYNLIVSIPTRCDQNSGRIG